MRCDGQRVERVALDSQSCRRCIIAGLGVLRVKRTHVQRAGRRPHRSTGGGVTRCRAHPDACVP